MVHMKLEHLVSSVGFISCIANISCSANCMELLDLKRQVELVISSKIFGGISNEMQ